MAVVFASPLLGAASVSWLLAVEFELPLPEAVLWWPEVESA